MLSMTPETDAYAMRRILKREALKSIIEKRLYDHEAVLRLPKHARAEPYHAHKRPVSDSG